MGSQPDQDRSGSPDGDRLDSELSDAFDELIGLMIERLDDLGRRFSLPTFCVKALHMLSSPMAMKELGQRFHCDPSFVTSIADMLDSRGLGRRETDTKDRRVKNILLTKAGIELRARLEGEMAALMPWASALDESERECLLRLVRKMNKAGHRQTAQRPAGQRPTGQRPTGQRPAGQRPAEHSHPAVATGGNRAGEVKREPSPATPTGS